MKRYAHILLAVAATVIGIAAYAWSGLYNVGADVPHWAITFRALQTFRDRSIRRRSEGIRAPDLSDPRLILKGAGQYAAMCAACHLQPGVENSEMRAGLYPRPPVLSKARVSARDAFWVIKHGIKMSAMPAWGGSHDDATIWSMVAFLQKLPNLTQRQYEGLVAAAPRDTDMDMRPKDGP